MSERLVEIMNTDGRYFISDLGRVYSVRSKKYVEPSLVRGYLQAYVRGKRYYIHRLVAEYFCEKIPSKNQVNHKDGCKTNNNWTNLEWVTTSENQLHAIRTGLVIKRTGEKASRAKLKESDIFEIKKLYPSLGQQAIAFRFKISQSQVNNIINNKTWRHLSESND